MIRHLFGQIISALIIVGFLVGWWLSAEQDFGVMAQQAMDLILWVGSMFEPLVSGLFNSTSPST